MGKTLEFKIKIDSESGKIVTLKKEFDGLTNTVAKTSNNLNKFTAHITKMAHIGAGLYVVNKVFEVIKNTIQETVIEGIQLNKTLEDAKNGIAALITANTTGRNAFNRFNVAVKMSGDILNKLRLASIKTAATFPELTDIFQNSIGDAISAGKSFGKDLNDIINNTIKLDERISNIANAIGMPMWQVDQEVRSILEGTVTADSRIATMLHITNKEINKAKQSAGGLVEYLNQKLAAFDVLANTNTLSKAFARVKESIDNVKIAVTKPLFNDLKKQLNNLNKWLNDNQKNIIYYSKVIYFGLKKAGVLINAVFIQPVRIAFNSVEIIIKKFLAFFADKLAILEEWLNGLADKMNKLAKFIHIDFRIVKSHKFANWAKDLRESTKGDVDDIKDALKQMTSLPKNLHNIDWEFTKSVIKDLQKSTKKINSNLKLSNSSQTNTKELQKEQNLYNQIHSLYVSLLPKEEQLNEWKKEELKKINQITDKTLKQKALKELEVIYEAKKVNILNKQNKIYDEQYKKAKELLKSLRESSMFPTDKAMFDYQNNLQILSQGLSGEKLAEGKELAYRQYLKEANGWDNQIIDMYLDLSKKFGESSAKTFVNVVDAFLKSNNWKDFFTNLGKNIAKSSKNIWGGLAGFAVQHTGELLSYMFDKQYDEIKSKYKGLIAYFNQQSRNFSFRSNAYNVFGQEGYGQVAKLQGELVGIKATKEEYLLNYELMKRSKGYKQIVQHTLEAASIAGGIAAAAYFDGGAALQGLNMAVNAKKWADEVTGFKNFQQAFVESVNKLKESIRQFANDLINLAGSVYKNIKDYRSLYDKLTGTNTYKLQQEKEALELVGKYTKLTESGVADLIQKILKGSAEFINKAVATTKNVGELLKGNILKKYNLSITALNSKFKESVSLVVDLLNKQKEANIAISNYVTSLKQDLGIANNEDYASAQSEAAKAIQDYKAGKIDYNDMLSKVKAYQSLAGIRSDKKIIKALEGITKTTPEEYIQNILKSNNGAMPLPSTQIDALKSPEIETLNVIKDTKSILEHLADFLHFGFKSAIKILQDILDVLKNILGAIWKGVSKLITNMFKGLSNLEKTIVNAIIKAIKNIGGSAVSGIGHLVGNIPIVGGVVHSVTHSIGHVFKHFGFAEGGYTGLGSSYVDKTGERVAGIVHAGEWVAPKWMVKKYSSLFKMLENVRNGGQLQLPIIAAQPVNAINVNVDIEEIKTTNEILKEQYIIQKKMLYLLQKFDEEGIKCVS